MIHCTQLHDGRKRSFYLGDEALDSRVRPYEVQERGHDSSTETGGGDAHEERAPVTEANVVRVTRHVVHEDLLGAGLWSL